MIEEYGSDDTKLKNQKKKEQSPMFLQVELKFVLKISIKFFSLKVNQMSVEDIGMRERARES